MSRITSKHFYLALALAVVATVSSGLYQDRLYQRMGRILLTGSGIEAGIDAGAITEDPATAPTSANLLAGVTHP